MTIANPPRPRILFGLTLLPPPALGERRHRSLARRFIAVGRALPSEMKVPEVCDLENHKCDNGDNQECRQRNHFMPCLKHPIAP
jgi:hypothetical protein